MTILNFTSLIVGGITLVLGIIFITLGVLKDKGEVIASATLTCILGLTSFLFGVRGVDKDSHDPMYIAKQYEKYLEHGEERTGVLKECSLDDPAPSCIIIWKTFRKDSIQWAEQFNSIERDK